MRIPQPEPRPQPFPDPSDPRRRPDVPPRPEPQPDGFPTPDPEPRPKPAASLRWPLTLGVVLALLGACDQWALSFNSEGLFLSVFILGGDDLRRDGYRVRTRDAQGTSRFLDVPQSGQLSLRGLAPGRYELTLLPPEGCVVSQPNPRNLTVSAEESVTVTFDVSCR
jgi:hypothetical protein